MVYILRFFLFIKCSLFHNSNLFGSCLIHILYTRCAKIKKKNNSGAKMLILFNIQILLYPSSFKVRLMFILHVWLVNIQEWASEEVKYWAMNHSSRNVWPMLSFFCVFRFRLTGIFTFHGLLIQSNAWRQGLWATAVRCFLSLVW